MLADVATGDPRLVSEMTVMTALRCVYDRARSRGLGCELPLVPAPASPSELPGHVFGLAH